MKDWEKALRAATTVANNGVEPIENIIDSAEEKVVELKMNLINPELVKKIIEMVKRMAPGFEVKQLT